MLPPQVQCFGVALVEGCSVAEEADALKRAEPVARRDGDSDVALVGDGVCVLLLLEMECVVITVVVPVTNFDSLA